jgi:hypothetical protein
MARRWLVRLLLVGMLGSIAAPGALAAGPERFRIDLSDPDIVAGETAFATEVCGFPVEVTLAGHIIGRLFPEDGRSPVDITTFAARGTYTNPATGASVRFTDAGPDRWYLKDGVLYLAITGRSVSGSGVIGIVVFDTDTWDIVHQAGNEVGWYLDWICPQLAA